MQLRLTRDTSDNLGTRGTIAAGDVVVQTLERPWIPAANSRGGTKGISCVPPGLYRLERHDSEAHPKTWALVNHALDVYHYDEQVPTGKVARTLVLIHPANRVGELRGCIAPGMRRTNWGSQPVVEQSVVAMERLKKVVAWVDGNTLEIV